MEEGETNFIEKKFWQKPKFLAGTGFGLVVALVLTFGAATASGRFFFGSFSASVSQSLGDIFGIKKEIPVFELNLESGEAVEIEDSDKIESEGTLVAEVFEEKSGVVVQKPAQKVEEVAKKESEAVKENVFTEKSSGSSEVATTKKEIIKPAIKNCAFLTNGAPSRTVSFNEVAWMGGVNSSNDEWIELKNNFSSEIDLHGWQIKSESEKVEIVFGGEEKILANGLFLMERTNDVSVWGVKADKIYSGALANEGEWLKIFNADCSFVDEINASSSWVVLGGDNGTKRTLERNRDDFGWHTSIYAGGTPREENSQPSGEDGAVIEIASSQSDAGGESQSDTQDIQATSSAQAQTETKVLISEVMAGSSASANDEFIEIYSYGSEAADLTGWTIKKKSSSGAESSLLAASRLEGKVVPPGKYLLLAHDGGYAGAAPADVLWPSSYSLAYTNNSITIYNASGGVVDQVSWAEIPKDKSYARTSLDFGASFSLLDTPTPTNSSQ